MQSSVIRCSHNHLRLNIKKTKELKADCRPSNMEWLQSAPLSAGMPIVLDRTDDGFSMCCGLKILSKTSQLTFEMFKSRMTGCVFMVFRELVFIVHLGQSLSRCGVCPLFYSGKIQNRRKTTQQRLGPSQFTNRGGARNKSSPWEKRMGRCPLVATLSITTS